MESLVGLENTWKEKLCKSVTRKCKSGAVYVV